MGKPSTKAVADARGSGCYLVGRWVVEEAERGTAEDVGVESLLSVLVREGLVPVQGGEFEDAAAGPARREAKEIAAAPQARWYPHGSGRNRRGGEEHRAIIVGRG